MFTPNESETPKETTPHETTATTDKPEQQAQQDGEQQTDPAPEEPKYKVKYNGEEMELAVTDLITHAQKGMNYDHVHQDLETTRKTSAEAKASLERLTDALSQFGYAGSPQEIADALEAQQREVEPEQVRRERKAREAQEIARTEAEAARADADAIRREAVFARDLLEIQRINPNVQTLNELGDKFFKLRAAGLDNLEAYELLSHKPAKKEPAGKDHLITTGGGKGTDSAREIPKSQLAEWREDFPNDTQEQLKARYNRALNAGKE